MGDTVLNKPKRKIYLDNIPREAALQKLMDALNQQNAAKPAAEAVPVEESLGMITAAAVFARISSPHYHASAMDGYAVSAIDTFGASEASPRRLKVGEQAKYVDTGDPLPHGFNAVVMIENVYEIDDDTIEINAAVVPWEHVRVIGENIVKTELILPENHRISPPDIGAMLAGGVNEVNVWRKPHVAIMPTGTELVPARTPLKEGDIIDFNSPMLAAYAVQAGAAPKRFPIVADVYAKIKETILEAAQTADIVVINAGSSAGSEDFTAKAIGELGEVLVHGVAIRPGKPVILGIVEGKPCIGLPGYPVSAVLTFELFVMPLIARLLGGWQPEQRELTATLSRRIVSPLGAEEYVRVKLGQVGEHLIATPVARGASVVMSLVRADGTMVIPRADEGVEARETIAVNLLRDASEIMNTVVGIGSHDITLDILADEVKKQHPDLSLSSAHVGSMGGIMALKKGEAHFAGIHLLDEATGEYNRSYLQRLVPELDIVLMNLVFRQQGLIVQKGNPKGITGLTDLASGNLAYVNRQRGAGTRILLDYKLQELDINATQINGYAREEFTHTAVAAAVASGTADTGLGILAAARALELDFVPVMEERYDLAVPKVYFESGSFQQILAVIRSERFRQRVAALGGYDTRLTGTIL